MKKIFVLGILLLTHFYALPQEVRKKVYFLADTVKLNKFMPKKVLDITWTSPFHYSFIFACDYKAPYYKYLTFSCLVDSKNPRARIEVIKPTHKFITLKDLLILAAEHPMYFSDIYDLYITELLPGKKYQTNRVIFIPQSAPTTDAVIIRNKYQ